MDIEHLERVGGSDANVVAIEAWLETVRAGYSDPTATHINWDDRVSVMRHNGIVGLIVWRYTQWNKQAFILLGWVRSDSRRQGVYTSLYWSVRDEAKKLGATKIVAGIHKDNAASLGMAQSLGRRQVSVTVEDDL